MDPPRRSVIRRRRHRPPAIVGDGIEYPPDPYSWEARVTTVGFVMRAIKRRGVPRPYRWGLWLFAAAFAAVVVASLLTSLF